MQTGSCAERSNATPLLQNELAILEFIHCFVEVLDKHFGQVCELDIMNEPDMVGRQCSGSCCTWHPGMLCRKFTMQVMGR